MNRILASATLALPTLLFAGCGAKPVYFPEQSMDSAAKAVGAVAAYDTDDYRQGRLLQRPDFFLFADANGRVNRIAYDPNHTGAPGQFVNLDDIPFSKCRHLFIILDGFGYGPLKEFYDSGHLRMFHEPSRVISTYPAMTDLAIEDIFNSVLCPAFEAMYYDPNANATVGGASAYLAGKNEPYNALLQYRANTLTDVIGYLSPVSTYAKELNDSKVLFDKGQTREFLVYYVSSAGISTAFGKAGQLAALAQVERLINQVIMETRGMTKVTLTADHGHSYTPSTRIPLEKALECRGWRIRDDLREPNDVVYIRFGLETMATFSTRQPERLARDLIATDGIELASFTRGDAVVVLAKSNRGTGFPACPDKAQPQPACPESIEVAEAVIRQSQKGNRQSYQSVSGDPLELAPILARLKPDADGYYDANDVMDATVTHHYPAPLQRLYRAHFAGADHIPDVIVSLDDKYYSGATSLGGAVNVASTHGGLNARNSTTFIMSTIAPLPPYMRSRDISPNMEKITGEPFPLRK